MRGKVGAGPDSPATKYEDSRLCKISMKKMCNHGYVTAAYCLAE
jgi:hypothetical protein